MKLQSPLWKVVFVAALFAAFQIGCASDGGGPAGDDDAADDDDTGATRSLSGTLSLPGGGGALRVGGSKAQEALTCTDYKVCCSGYDGTVTVGDLAASAGDPSICEIAIDLPLNTFCFCAIFSGEDSADDSDECPDTYVASLGCSERGYGGDIPVAADAAGSSEDPIDLGTSSIEGLRVVSANNPCDQVDSDGNGTANADETGRNPDVNTDGCRNADEMDSNADGTPDIYQPDVWTALPDSDADGIPDFCDVVDAGGCEPTEDDADGNCIPDQYDYCLEDLDQDGIPFCLDCNPASDDLEASLACYPTYCTVDNDGDGFNLCNDCNDEDATVTYECFDPIYTSADRDRDGFGAGIDCNDGDPAVTIECHGDFCTTDSDEDRVLACDDCNDYDADNTITWEVGCCAYDGDQDGVGICEDCDDSDPAKNFSTDADADEAISCWDCDDADATVTYECWGMTADDWGTQDNDEDGILAADDCNDYDSANTVTREMGCCSFDGDQDGSTICEDCSDDDPNLNWQDADGDRVSTCAGDCDDADAATTFECYETAGGVNFCDDPPDYDGDLVGFCDDCDDFNPENTVTHAIGCCSFDGDDDGAGFCEDCSDDDPALNNDDADADGFSTCMGDCDDADPAVTPAECYQTTGGAAAGDYCEQDNDGDLVLACDDCDDRDPDNNVTHEAGCFNYDGDGDGYGRGQDCNDYSAAENLDDVDGDQVSTCAGDCDDSDASVTYECLGGGGGGTGGCETFDYDRDTVTMCDDCNDFDAGNTINRNTGGDCMNYDGDGDGAGVMDDCNDADATLNNQDADGDGASTCMGDCDDNDPAMDLMTCLGGGGGGGEVDWCATTDYDGDLVGVCDDCDDFDSTNRNTISGGCPGVGMVCTDTTECQGALPSWAVEMLSQTTCNGSGQNPGICEINCGTAGTAEQITQCVTGVQAMEITGVSCPTSICTFPLPM